MIDRSTYHFLFFGLTSFDSLPQREQALATECARTGHHVDFIEIPRSTAGRTQALLHRMFSPLSRETGFARAPEQRRLRVHTPPTLPTGFRSSLAPALDRSIFQQWFRRRFAGTDFSQSIAMIMLPLWWGNLIDRSLLNPRLLVYDVCDALEVQGRTDRALRRLHRHEAQLAAEADLVTYSAHEEGDSIRRRFPRTRTLLLPNAVSTEFVEQCDAAINDNPRISEGTAVNGVADAGDMNLIKECRSINGGGPVNGNRSTDGGGPVNGREPVNGGRLIQTSSQRRPVIGYIGATCGKWFDAELLFASIERFPEYDFCVVGPVTGDFAVRCEKYPNVTLLGFVPHRDLPLLLRSFDAAVIPFLSNAISDVVNPLKLYEYAAAGLPIIAAGVKELMHYSDIVALADTREAFFAGIRHAVEQTDCSRRDRLRSFARQNTWDRRVRRLLDTITEHVAAA